MPRIRVSKACNACSRRKLKCDGKSPCVQCITSQWECEYTPTTKKRGPPKGYRKITVESQKEKFKFAQDIISNLLATFSSHPYLNSQLSHLRDLLNLPFDESIFKTNHNSNIQTSINSSSNLTLTPALGSAMTPSCNTIMSTPGTISSTYTSPAMSSDLPTLNRSSSFIPIDPKEEEITRWPEYTPPSSHQNNIINQPVGGTRYWGASSGLYMLPPIRAVESSPSIPTLPPPPPPSSSAPDYLRMIEPVFSDEVCEHLLQTFFTYIHPLYPFIYKPSLGTVNFSNRNLIKSIIPPVLLYAILASAVNFSDHPKVSKDNNNHLNRDCVTVGILSEYTRQLLYLEHLSPKVSTVQALLLCCHREIGCGQSSRGWLYGGMAIRMAVDLGLHRSDELLPDLSYAERQMRRRTFWSCYVIDRVTAALLGRPITLRDEDIDAILPSEHEADEFDLWHSGNINSSSNYQTGIPFYQSGQKSRCISNFLCYIQLARILGNILCKIYSQQVDPSNEYTDELVQGLERQLDEWYSNLPHWIVECTLPHHNILMMWHQLCIIILHRSFISQRIGQRSSSWRPKGQEATSLEKCRIAADRLVNMITRYSTAYGLQKCSSMVMFGLFAAAAIFLPDALTNPIAKRKLDKCLTYLSDLSCSWILAGQLYKIAKNHRDAVLTVGETIPPSPVTPSTQYNPNPIQIDTCQLFTDDITNITWGDFQVLFPLMMQSGTTTGW